MKEEQPSKESFDALAFYEKHVDNLWYTPKDYDYPKFDFEHARRICLINGYSKDKKIHWTPIYGEKKFKEYVANHFGTTIKEMDLNWRHFK